MVSSSLSVFEYVSIFLLVGAASQDIKMVRFSIVTLFHSIILFFFAQNKASIFWDPELLKP